MLLWFVWYAHTSYTPWGTIYPADTDQLEISWPAPLAQSYRLGFVAWMYQIWIPVGPDISHRGCAYTVLETFGRLEVYSAAYGTVHYKEPLKSFEITVGHSPGFGLPSVAIVPWLCRKWCKAIFIYRNILHRYLVAVQSWVWSMYTKLQYTYDFHNTIRQWKRCIFNLETNNIYTFSIENDLFEDPETGKLYPNLIVSHFTDISIRVELALPYP